MSHPEPPEKKHKSKEESTGSFPFNADIWRFILQFVNTDDVPQVAKVCKTFRKFTSEDIFWKHLTPGIYFTPKFVRAEDEKKFNSPEGRCYRIHLQESVKESAKEILRIYVNTQSGADYLKNMKLTELLGDEGHVLSSGQKGEKKKKLEEDEEEEEEEEEKDEEESKVLQLVAGGPKDKLLNEDECSLVLYTCPSMPDTRLVNLDKFSGDEDEEEEEADEEEDEEKGAKRSKAVLTAITHLGDMGRGADGFNDIFIVTSPDSPHYGKIFATHADGGHVLTGTPFHRALGALAQRFEEAGDETSELYNICAESFGYENMY